MRFTLAALAALTIPAAAADMPLKAQPAPAPYSWAGWYAGANLGYGWGDPSATIVPGSIPPPFPGTLNSASPPFVMSTHPQGGLIGAQAGYNWQFDRTVVGLEIDFQYADVHDMVQRGFSNTFIFVGDPSTTAGVATLESHMNWLATLRGRFGYSFDRFLPYVTGGAALANLRSTITISGYHKDDGAPGPFAFFNTTATVHDTVWGYAIGGGADWAIDPRWSLRGEYLFVGLPGHTYGPLILGLGSLDNGMDLHLARLALNFKLWP